jgi:CBS domain-containing protein
MLLVDLMSRDVEVIRPDATLEEAARKMRERDVGSLPVCDGRRLLGMLTDRDIVVRAIAQGRDPRRTRVHEVHTERVLYAREDDEVRDVAHVMESEQIRRMPIVDRNKRLVGIVALGDLATEDEELSGEVLEGVSQPRHWSRLSQTGGGRAVHVGELTSSRNRSGGDGQRSRTSRDRDENGRSMRYAGSSWRASNGREARGQRGVAEKQIWDHDDVSDR